MNEYRVSWIIDLTADNPVDAAKQAQEIMRDPDSIATVFHVAEADQPIEEGVEIDLTQDRLTEMGKRLEQAEGTQRMERLTDKNGPDHKAEGN
jgi:hypothetical protein